MSLFAGLTIQAALVFTSVTRGTERLASEQDQYPRDDAQHGQGRHDRRGESHVKQRQESGEYQPETE